MKRQNFKRILSMALALIFIVGVLPITALAETDFGGESTADWKGFDEFSLKVSKLLSETMEDNYISAISLDIESGKMVVDGEEQPLVEGRDVAPVTKDDVCHTFIAVE